MAAIAEAAGPSDEELTAELRSTLQLERLHFDRWYDERRAHLDGLEICRPQHAERSEGRGCLSWHCAACLSPLLP